METEVEKPEAEQTQESGSDSEKNQAPDRHTEVEGDGRRPDNGHSRERQQGKRDPFEAFKRVSAQQQKDIQEMKALLSQIAQGKSSQSERSAPENASDSTKEAFWNAPESYVDKQVQARFEAVELKRAQRDADAYVLSQDFINQEADEEELRALSVQYGLDRLYQTEPMKAAKALVRLFKAEKGIGQSTASKSQVRSVQGGAAAPASNGKRVWSRKEIKAMGIDDFTKNEADIDAAFKEGRVKD